MKKATYSQIDWIYFFDKSDESNFEKIFSNPKNTGLSSELVTWKLITVSLPVVTFLSVAILNVLTNINQPGLFLGFLNNGSLPIISFGIITSGMPYLLEQLQDYPDFHIMRRRIMAIALIFLFLSASLYIVQTLFIINTKLNCITSFIMLITSIFVFFFARSIGVKMFVLQSRNINGLADEIENNVQNLQNAIEDLENE